jgi:gliding motility-associated protein GldE
LISNNFINVAIVILSTYVTSSVFNVTAYPVFFVFFQVVVITSVLLIFGEIAPKMFGHKEAMLVSNIMAGPLRILNLIFKPMSFLLISSTSVIDKRFAGKGHNISMSELSDAIELTVDEGAPEDEKMILKGIATLGEKQASEIMRSRVNVTALDAELAFPEVIRIVKDSGFSRIPVFRDNLDQVLGILYVKDLLPFIELSEKNDWASLIRPAFFVPENKRINDLLQEFREKKIHLAIVVDEYGGTSGIITLEDIIEEIVGEISDEFDKDLTQFKYRKLTDSSYLFEAKVPLNDLVKILDLDDEIFEKVRGESDSLGGLILELEGKIPEKGAVVHYGQFDFTIVEADERRIKEVKLTIKPVS